MSERDRFPGYDVLNKRHSLSWNDKTREVINARLAVPREPRFLSPEHFAILEAAAARIVPQPRDRAPVPIAAYVDEKLHKNTLDGYRLAQLPDQGECYRRGLAGLNEAAMERHAQPFVKLSEGEQDQILSAAQRGALRGGAWGDMPSALFFSHRLLVDVTTFYWAHPTAWSEMGFGGPASPRGYVRMKADRRDPWEAAEAKPGAEDKARRENAHVR
ncbi:gluconate 2-dehydrogenase subunit 3 family protein [Acidisoma sp. C75]